MPKHKMEYDFKDFERFVLESIERDGYQLAPGAKPEIADLSQIQDFDDMAQIMEQVIISVSVIPLVKSPEVIAPVQTVRPSLAKPTSANPVAKQANTTAGKDHPRTKHGYYSTNIERTPEEEAERKEYFRQKRLERKNGQKATSIDEAKPQSTITIPAVKVEVLPTFSQEVVAPSPLPFPKADSSNYLVTPGGRSFYDSTRYSGGTEGNDPA